MSSSSSSSFTSSFLSSAAAPPAAAPPAAWAAAAERLELLDPRRDQIRNRVALEASDDVLEFGLVELDPAGLQDLCDVLSSGLVLPAEVRHGVRGNVFHPHGGLADVCPAANP